METIDVSFGMDNLNYFDDIGNVESWMTDTAKNIHFCFRKLRNELMDNSKIWSDTNYWDRLAHLYFHLANYYYNNVYDKYKYDLHGVQYFLNKCWEEIKKLNKSRFKVDETLMSQYQQFIDKISELDQTNRIQIQNKELNAQQFIDCCILNGFINENWFSKFQSLNDNDKHKTKIMMKKFRLLRLICEMEQTFSSQSDDFILLQFNLSISLAQAYQLAGSNSINDFYLNNSNSLIEEQLNKDFNLPDYKTDIKNIVLEELTKWNSLSNVIIIISDKFGNLSSDDVAYIRRKYITALCDLWMLEFKEKFLQVILSDKRGGIILDVFNASSLSDIRNIHEVFRTGYYKLLLDHNDHVSNNKCMIAQLKKECLILIKSHSDSFKNELDFFDEFIKFLSKTLRFQSILSKLELKKYLDNTVTLSKLISNIVGLDEHMDDPKLTRLKLLANALLNKNDSLFFEDKFKDIVQSFIKPVDISEKRVDNRSIIEVIGKNIILTDVIQAIESKLESSIEEVRLIIDGTINIDTSLKKELWHGRNIVVMAKLIRIRKKVEWDVSGIDNDFAFSNAGTGDEGNGRNGDDGYPGESGGNVVVITQKIKNAEYLTIISNGGKGGKGQDGGNGVDGKDGQGIDIDAFERTFPPIKEKGLVSFRLQDLLKTIINKSTRVTARDRDGYKDLSLNNVGSVRVQDFYIEATTREGNEIVFSFLLQDTQIIHTETRYDMYILYKGSSGKKGGEGGEYGLGGEGGYAGDISVKYFGRQDQQVINTVNIGQKGNDGDNGKGGLYGKHGVSGWDVAFTDDCGTRYLIFYEDPKYFGRDQRSKLHLNYYSSKNGDRVCCADRKFRNDPDRYAEISSSSCNYMGRRRLEERKNERNNRERQHHSKATRKKNINQSSIELNYLRVMNSPEKEFIKHLRTYELQQQNVNLKTEVKVNKHFGIPRPNEQKLECSVTLTQSMKPIQPDTYEENLEKLGFYLWNKDLNLDQLRKLYISLQKHDLTVELINKNLKCNDIFTEKYKLAVFQEIDLKIFRKFEPSKRDGSLQPKYLIYGSKIDTKIFVDDIGLLDPYLSGELTNCQRNKLLQYCRKNVDIIKKNALHAYEEFLFPMENSSSSPHRELAAYSFNVNLRFYIIDDYNDCVLKHNFNPDSDRSVYLLMEADQTTQLNEIKDIDYFFGKVVFEVDLLNSKNDLDKYLEEAAYLVETDSITEPSIDWLKIKLGVFSLEEYRRDFFQQYLVDVIEYFSEEEKQTMKEKFEKLQFVDHKSILFSMCRRFHYDGKKLSSDQIFFLVNTILISSNENSEENDKFSWIFLSQPQHKWIDRVVLSKLEQYYGKSLNEKYKWAAYLDKIESKNILILLVIKLDESISHYTVSKETMDETLYLLSNISNETVNLEELDLSEWSYALKENYWKCKIDKLFNLNENEFKDTCYYVLSLENIFGNELLEKLILALSEKSRCNNPEVLLRILANFYNGKWVLNLHILEILNENIDVWIEKMNFMYRACDEDRDIKQLVELIKNDYNSSQIVVEELNGIASTINLRRNANVAEFSKLEITEWAKKFKSEAKTSKPNINEKIQEILEVIDRAMELEKGFRLRDTQKLSVFLLFKKNASTLAQVSTGEGKSLIVVAASLIKALCGETVHVVTSSSVLAKRDAEINCNLYNLFDIMVSHNCNENVNKRKDAYLGNQVIYGDLLNFQRDYLLDKFYGINILSDHNFENVIIDEVDSMLLDKGNNMLYLSHDFPDLDKIESVLIFIWQFINKPILNEIIQMFDSQMIKDAVLHDMYGLLQKQDIDLLDSNLSEDKIEKIWRLLVEKNVISEEGLLVEKDISNDLLDKVLSPPVNCYLDRLSYLLKNLSERVKFISVPNSLKPFVTRHLDEWIKSAISAFFMKPGRDYVVDVDRTGVSPDRNPNITILDRETGTDLANSQWDEALYQFLQLKHGCKLSLLSMKSVFISNVSYFKLYRKLYGLTGTLGSRRERDLLKQIHQVAFVTIPTAKSKRFFEHVPIICENRQLWADKIFEVTSSIIKDKERSVLIICETVHDVETLHNAFGGSKAKRVFTYTREYEEFHVAKGTKELEQGVVIIATNLAGRGTDIKLSEGLRRAGGLHVCLTFLPNNIRIEQQAFGRAARNGDKGSGQLIVVKSEGKEYIQVKLLEMKKQRDMEELRRLANIKSYYENQITLEENYFNLFKQEFEKIKSYLHKQTDSVNEIKKFKEKSHLIKVLLQCCLDKWAFWLDRNSKAIESKTDKTSRKILDESFKNLISSISCLTLDCIYDLDKWILGDPVPTVKVAKYLVDNKKSLKAVRLLNEVIRAEPHFSETARYYKAYAISKLIDWGKNTFEEQDKDYFKLFKFELKEARKCFESRIKFKMQASAIVVNIKVNNKESIIQIDAFEKQQKSFIGLYSLFINTIDHLLGLMVTPENFQSNKITSENTQKLFDELIKNGVLKSLQVRKKINLSDTRQISYEYGITNELLKSFLITYRGLPINEINFINDLRKNILLPSREEFWNSLIEKNILIGELELVIVNSEILEENLYVSKLIKEGIDRHKLENLTWKAKDNDYVYLYPISETHLIFAKESFKKLIGNEKFVTLEKESTVFLNKRANLNREKLKSASLKNFDSISLEDFKRVNIPVNDSEKILNDLIHQGIIIDADKDLTGSDKSYKFNKNLDAIYDLNLKPCPVYEPAIKSLLSVCFSYRLALLKLESQIDEINSPITISLWSQPHKSLFLELVDQNIIKTAKVAMKDNDSIRNKVATILDVLNIKEKDKKDVLEDVTSVLNNCRSLINNLDVPVFSLKSLVDFLQPGAFGDAVEVSVLFLNGFDELIQAAEKKYQFFMILKTSIILGFGIFQVAVGVIIELFSAGAMTHVGGALISEGVSDLLFTASCFQSGYFSWKDYRRHKLMSMITTSASGGIGAFLSKGVNVSQFGLKIGGPNLEIGKKVAQMTGKELVKKVGRDKVVKEVCKRIITKSFHGIAIGFANTGIDFLVENCIQSLCNKMASEIIGNMEKAVANHNISSKLKEVHEKLGASKGKEMVNKLIFKVLTEKNFTDEILSVGRTIADTITQGIALGLAKRSKASMKVSFPIDAINKSLDWILKSAQLWKLITLTNTFLDSLTYKIQDELSERLGESRVCETKTEFETFRSEIIDQLKSVVTEKGGRVIIQHFVTPALQSASHKVIKFIGKGIKSGYRSFKENKYKKEFYKLKMQYEQNVINLNKNENAGKRRQLLDHLTDQYGENILKVFVKTKDPKLFAAIAKENIPMDFTCVYSSAYVCNNLLKKIGYDRGLTIVVKGESGIKQTISTQENSELIVELDLKNNHFYFSSNPDAQSDSSTSDKSNNNCLYYALYAALPEIMGSLSPNEFRNEVANSILNNSEIQNHLKQAWHHVPAARGMLGGGRPRRQVVGSINSDSQSDLGSDFKPPLPREKAVKDHAQHFVDRFTWLLFFAGKVQRVSEMTGVNRRDIIEGGPSQFQDGSSGRGRDGIHAGHVVRIRLKEDFLKRNHEELTFLKKFLGHTQNVERGANEFYGPGGIVDRFQSDQSNINILNSIDFYAGPTADNIKKCKELKSNYLKIFDEFSRGINEPLRRKMLEAKTLIERMSLEQVFIYGQHGYEYKRPKTYKHSNRKN